MPPKWSELQPDCIREPGALPLVEDPRPWHGTARGEWTRIGGRPALAVAWRQLCIFPAAHAAWPCIRLRGSGCVPTTTQDSEAALRSCTLSVFRSQGIRSLGPGWSPPRLATFQPSLLSSRLRACSSSANEVGMPSISSANTSALESSKWPSVMSSTWKMRSIPFNLS